MDAMLYALLVTGFAITGFRLHRLSQRLTALEQGRVPPRTG
jgi:hypothetical protein